MACSWSQTFDFSVDMGGWQILLGTMTGSGVVHGDAKPSACWYRGSRVQYQFPNKVDLTHVRVTYNVVKGSGNCAPSGVSSQLRNASSTVLHQVAFISQNDFVHSWTGTLSLDTLRIYGHSSVMGSKSSLNGSVLMKSLVIEGVGINPFYTSIINAISVKVGDEFDAGGLTLARLQAIDTALQSYSSTDINGMLTLTATYPEIEAPLRQRKLNETFISVKSALQASSSTNPQPEFGNYLAAIESAFGVTFTVEDPKQAPELSAEPWSLIAIHFARLGLETTARAFEQWVKDEIEQQNLCQNVDRFALFKRIMGQIEFRNVGGYPQTFVAKNELDSVRYIKINLRSAGGNWYMTPNNVIHELGHWFDNNSGYLYNKIGSLEYEVHQTSITSRAGMAEERAYLSDDELFYIHSTIVNNNGNLEFQLWQTTVKPANSDPEYAEFVPERFLFFDVAGNDLALWQHPVYANRYENIARFDMLVQNYGLDALETSGDAFLNWVRDMEYLREFQGIRERRPFYDPTTGNAGSSWVSFFETHMGMFLRNAVIYNYPGGMVQFYKDQGVIPQTPIATGSVNLSRQLRLTPSEPLDNNNTTLIAS